MNNKPATIAPGHAYTKGKVWDVFYTQAPVSRAGGGMPKKKICRQQVSAHVVEQVAAALTGDTKTLEYFNKLLARKSGVAPPPRPKA